MPEYLAPGVYVEEISFAAKPIEGVPTSTAGFVGIAPFSHECALGPFTSLTDFARRTGATPHGETSSANWLWHAVRAFFVEGGARLWFAAVSQEAVSKEGAPQAFERALLAVTAVDDVSVIAAPGVTHTDCGWSDADTIAVSSMLLAHAAPKRFALLDAPNGQSPQQVRAWRARLSSAFGAVYWPWLTVSDDTGASRSVAPSAAIAGLYARCDREHGVWKAPTDEPLHSAIGVEFDLNDGDSERLNDEGINTVRAFPNRGIRVWGARTVAPSASEWKYVNVRRFVCYVESSIAHGIQWAVHEPNGEPLWTQLKRSIDDFLNTQWRCGALLGDRTEEAYFVNCGRGTMTQHDIDNGRVIVVIGVAVVRPAEFVVFRIGIETCKRSD